MSQPNTFVVTHRDSAKCERGCVTLVICQRIVILRENTRKLETERSKTKRDLKVRKK